MKKIMICLAALVVLGGAGYYALASNSNKVSNVKQTTKQAKSNKNENSDSNNSKKPVVKQKAKNTGSEDLIPKEYQGNWYAGNKLFCTITSNEIDIPNSEYQKKITKDSSPLKLPAKNANGSYTINDLQYMTAAGGDLAYYWLSSMTINGKKEPVIAGAHRQLQYTVLTQHPTDKNYSFISNEKEEPNSLVGVQNLDKYYSEGTNMDDYAKKFQDNDTNKDSHDDSNSNSNDSNQKDSSTDSNSKDTDNND